MVGVDRGARAGELGRGGHVGGGTLLVPLDQAADVLLHLSQVGEGAVHSLEQGDDVALERLPVGGLGGGAEACLDGLELTPEGPQPRLAHREPSMPVSARRSVDESSLRLFRMMMVRSGRVTIPAM